MPAITIQDLENAKADVDFIAEVATSLAPTATDRLGHVKQTLAGAVGSIAAITDRGAWATGAAYLVKDLVTVVGVVYVCVLGHTAGATFAGDSANWRVYQGVLQSELAAPGGAAMVGIGGGRTQADKNAEFVSAKDFGAVGDGVADDTASIQSALDYAAELTSLGIQGRSFNKEFVVKLPSGYFSISTLTMKPGVTLVGTGPTSTVLVHQGGGVPAIETGKYLVPSDRGAIEDKRSGGVKHLAIIGKKDPSFNVGTVAGRVGKTHTTSVGINADGATNNLVLKNLLIMYCHNGIIMDRCYTANIETVEVDSCTEDGIVIYGGNMTSIRNSRFSANSRYGMRFDRQESGTSEAAKCIRLESVDIEYNLYDGIYAMNVRQLSLNEVYNERNSQIADDGSYVGRASFMTFDATNGSLKGNIKITNSLFNCISSTLKDFDLLNILRCDGAEIDGCRFASNNTALTANCSFMRIGQNAGAVLLGLNTFPRLDYVIAVAVDAGSTAMVASKERMSPRRNLILNGDLSSWAQGTSQAAQGISSADRMEVYRTGAAVQSFARQSFDANQTAVPGFPKYYARHSITGSSTSWGVRAYCGEIGSFPLNSKVSNGLWIRSGIATTVKLRTRRIYTGSGFVDSQTTIFALGTDWINLNTVFQDPTAPPATTITSPSYVIFEIEFDENLADSYYDIANLQSEFGGCPSTFERISATETANLCLPYVTVLPTSLRFAGDVTSGRTYKHRVDWPAILAEVPTVTLLSASGTNVTFASVTVTEVTQYGCTLNIPASATGYAEYSCSIRAKTLI